LFPVFSWQDAGDRVLCCQTEAGQEDHSGVGGKDHQDTGQLIIKEF